MLQRALQGKSGSADTDLVDYLGSRPAESVRAVQGLLQRVLNAAESKGVSPTAALAREVLEAPAPKPPRRSTAVRYERHRCSRQRGAEPGENRMGLARCG